MRFVQALALGAFVSLAAAATPAAAVVQIEIDGTPVAAGSNMAAVNGAFAGFTVMANAMSNAGGGDAGGWFMSQSVSVSAGGAGSLTLSITETALDTPNTTVASVATTVNSSVNDAAIDFAAAVDGVDYFGATFADGDTRTAAGATLATLASTYGLTHRYTFTATGAGQIFNIDATTRVPEPATLGLLAGGLTALGAVAARRRTRR